jgi:hypothetical protein
MDGTALEVLAVLVALAQISNCEWHWLTVHD